MRGLRREPSLLVAPPRRRRGAPSPEYTAATAEAAVKQGVAPAALIIPKGFGANPVAFGPGTDRQPIQVLHDSSDPVAAQMVAGLLQKVVMTSLPDTMADVGMKYFDQCQRRPDAAAAAEYRVQPLEVPRPDREARPGGQRPRRRQRRQRRRPGGPRRARRGGRE